MSNIALSIPATILGRERHVPHISRKFYHMLTGLMCFFLYAFVVSEGQALLLLAIVGGFLVLSDFCRFRSPRLNAFALRIFGRLMRREELSSLSGNSFYIIGLLVIALFFPKPIALLSLLFLAVGDPVAAIVGTRFGKHKLRSGKSIEGIAANLAVSGLVALIFGMLYLGLPVPKAAGLALVGGLISAIAESCPLPFDDNFTIPVVSAGLLFVAGECLPHLFIA